MLDLLTSTRAKDARACKRLHKLRYLLGYAPAAEADALRFGTAWHALQEAWWLAPAAERLARALALLASLVVADDYERVTLEALICAYDARWGGEEYEVLAIERQFRAPLINPATGAASRTWQIGGKVDGLLARDGRRLLLEHKTTSEDAGPGSDYWAKLRLDGQISIYYDGAASLGFHVDDCLYDVVSKPRIRPSAVPVLDDEGQRIVLDSAGARARTKDGKKWRQTADSAAGLTVQTRQETAEEFRARLVADIAADPSRYLSRGAVVRLESEIDEARADLWALGRELAESAAAGRFPRNPDACMRWGRKCAFWPVCTGEASIEDPKLYRKLETVHPELEAA